MLRFATASYPFFRAQIKTMPARKTIPADPDKTTRIKDFSKFFQDIKLTVKIKQIIKILKYLIKDCGIYETALLCS